jgi:DNA repair exonuclease SbcCD nuclease subunit
MNYITGDTHGDRDQILATIAGNKLTKGDRLFICGDFGFIWAPETAKDNEDKFLDKLNDLGIEILFVDGNHENFDRLFAFPVSQKYGGQVSLIRDNIVYLHRGQVFTIDGKTIFTMGGGISIDRKYRRKGESWWPQELASEEEEQVARFNLDRYHWKVNYVITHAAPLQAYSFLLSAMQGSYNTEYCDLKLDTLADEGRFLSLVHSKLTFDEWHFGHFHQDSTDNRFFVHYLFFRPFF